MPAIVMGAGDSGSCLLIGDREREIACPCKDQSRRIIEQLRYFAGVDRAKIAESYANKRVFYLCGQQDSNPNDASLGKSCGAMMQGAHRLQRMLAFQSFLEFKYGNAALRNHQFAVIPRVGHHGFGTMTSPAGLRAMFAPIR